MTAKKKVEEVKKVVPVKKVTPVVKKVETPKVLKPKVVKLKVEEKPKQEVKETSIMKPITVTAPPKTPKEAYLSHKEFASTIIPERKFSSPSVVERCKKIFTGIKKNFAESRKR